MEIYYYCSYTGSPVGFQMGKLTYDGQTNGTLKLESLDNPTCDQRFIQCCFDQRAVRKVYQCSKEENKYFFLLKGLSAKGKNPGDPEQYYINFAVLTDQLADFKRYFRGKNVPNPKETIPSAVRDTMQLDKESEFGFTICGKEVRQLLNLSYRTYFGDGFRIQDEQTIWEPRPGIFLELISPNVNLEQLMQALKYSGNCAKIEIPGNWFELGELGKKKARGKRIPLLILLAVLAALFLRFQKVFSESLSQLSHCIRVILIPGG